MVASPLFPLTAPTPVGLGGAPLGPPGAVGAGGEVLGTKGLEAGADPPPPDPGLHIAGLGAAGAEMESTITNLEIAQSTITYLEIAEIQNSPVLLACQISHLYFFECDQM